MLADARDTQRRDAFRQTQVKTAIASFDNYLKFLRTIQKVFSSSSPAEQRSTPQLFKL